MNVFLGVFFHWLGGLASASFYIPYRGVRRWSWETYWLVGGVFSWIIAPWALALLLVPNLCEILAQAEPRTLFLAYFFGAMWGLGGLTFGLTMRYLGIGLGMAIALGYCAAVGTLAPPIIHGKMGEIVNSTAGIVTLVGVAVCLAGIAVAGLAGISKERELPEEQKRAAVKEFNFVKGLLVATFSGIFSAAFAVGLDFAEPIADVAKKVLVEHGSSDLWKGLPKLIVVLLGGFTTNFIWCLILNLKNRSGHEYLALSRTAVAEVSATEGVAQWDADELPGSARNGLPAQEPVPLAWNYLFSALAGTTWYFQFFFYSMGETRMGDFQFSSWTLHMASIIIFSSLWGIVLHEWKGTSLRTHRLIAVALAVLIASTLIVGYGNYLNKPKHATVGQIERFDPRLDQLVAPDATIEKLAEGFQWAEGPVWIPADRQVLFSDIPNNAVMRWSEAQGLAVFLKPAGYTGKEPRGGESGTNGLTLDRQGRLVMCQHGDRRVVRVEKDGTWTTLVDRYEGKRLNSPNDLVFKSNGDLYFTDPPYGLAKGPDDPARELPFCGVYRVTPDGKVTLLTDKLTRPNGLAFSPDEKTLYVAQSEPDKAVWTAFDVLPDGTLGPGRLFFDATPSVREKLPGLPDGLKIDRRGNLFATGPGGISVFSPDGKLLGRINTGVPTSNCCFGDGYLYMTANQWLCRVKLAP